VTESILRSIDSPERQAEAFPILTLGQIDRIRPYGRVRAVRPGEILSKPGIVCLCLFCFPESSISYGLILVDP
jgi:hypothetical protein